MACGPDRGVSDFADFISCVDLERLWADTPFCCQTTQINCHLGAESNLLKATGAVPYQWGWGGLGTVATRCLAGKFQGSILNF